MTVWKSRNIHDGWSFKKTNSEDLAGATVKKDEVYTVQQFPTTVHVELLKQKKIPDPVCPSPDSIEKRLIEVHSSSSVCMNGMCSVRSSRSSLATSQLTKARLVGIGEADWEFSTTFDVSDDEYNAPNVDLVFDGLDTFATVSLVCMIIEYSAIYTHIQSKNGTELTK